MLQKCLLFAFILVLQCSCIAAWLVKWPPHYKLMYKVAVSFCTCILDEDMKNSNFPMEYAGDEMFMEKSCIWDELSTSRWVELMWWKYWITKHRGN